MTKPNKLLTRPLTRIRRDSGLDCRPHFTGLNMAQLIESENTYQSGLQLHIVLPFVPIWLGFQLHTRAEASTLKKVKLCKIGVECVEFMYAQRQYNIFFVKFSLELTYFALNLALILHVLRWI